MKRGQRMTKEERSDGFKHETNREDNRRSARAGSSVPGIHLYLVDRYGLLLRLNDQVRRTLI